MKDPSNNIGRNTVKVKQIEYILSHFNNSTPTNSDHISQSPCPVCNNLVTINCAGSKAEIHCQAGCTKNHILNAVGLHKADLIFSPNGHKPKTPKQLFTDYWQKRGIQKQVPAKVIQEIVTYYTHTSQGETKFQYSYLSQEAIPEERDVKPFQRLNHSGEIKHYLYIPDAWETYKKKSEMYVVEGIPDTLTLREIGLNCVGIRSKGGAGSALSELKAFVDYAGIQRVIVMSDLDAWDDWCHVFKSSEVFKDGSKSKLYFVHFDSVRKAVNFPEKKDVNDVWKALQDERKLRSAVIQNTTHEYDVKGEYDIDAINEAVSHYEIKDYLCHHFNTTAEKKGSGENQEWRIKDQGGLFVNTKKQISRPDEGKGAGAFGIIGAITLAKFGKWKESDPQKFITVLHDAANLANIKPSYRIETTTKDPYILNNNGKATTEQQQRERQASKQEHTSQEPEEELAASNGYHLTDLGNAQRFTFHFQDTTKFNHDIGCWFTWTGSHWKRESESLPIVMKRGKETVNRMYRESTKLDFDDKRRIALRKWAEKSESKRSLVDMIYLAQTEDVIGINSNSLDAHPYSLNCKNGIIDLKTGELLPHDKGKLLTKLVDIEYDENALCPTWEKAILSYMGFTDGKDSKADNDALELYNYLQKAVGYTLTGDISEQCLFFLYGEGRNGKSTFINTLALLLNDYFQHIPIQALLTKKYEGVTNNDLAQTPGKRLIVSSEIPEGKRLNESLVKDMVGGDAITARFMRKDPFSFYPVFKLWIFGNEKPLVSPSESVFRRIHLIPFNVQIPQEEVDPHFDEKLKKELPGILAWAVKGCLLWQKEGLNPPAKVKEATRAYRDEMDVLTDFIEENCTVIEGGSELVKVSVKALYDEYVKWSTEDHQEYLPKRDFNKRLKKKYPSLIKKPVHGNVYTWFGIGLKAPAPDTQKQTDSQPKNKQTDTPDGDNWQER